MVYKFRVILDAEEDIFRDIAILDDTLEDLQMRSSILLDLMEWKWPLAKPGIKKMKFRF
jgi:hypothetical protein